MGFTLPSKTVGGNAPEVEDGLALARFDDLKERFVQDFVTESNKFGKPDDGKRLDFIFTLLDEEGAVVYDPETGDPIELRNLKTVKPGATGEKSNFYAYLSGLLTAKELAAWDAATDEDPFDGSFLPGRVVHVKIGHTEKGWPGIESVVGIAKAKVAK